MYAIESQDLTKFYGHRFLWPSAPSISALNLSVEQGEIFGFLGRNGAGKTTTIKILCGLLRPSRGRAWIFGQDLRERSTRKLFGYLPENPYFYEYLTPVETLDFYARLEGLSKDARRREWDELSEMLDLRDLENQRIRGFSKGMRQRLGFAVALVGNPKLLILDEPMTGLDPLGRRTIRELILLMRERGKTIFFSSHVLGDVEQICDRVGILQGGRLTEESRIEDLLTRQVKRVEVIATGLTPETIEALGADASRSRQSEDGVHFFFDDPGQADEAVRRIHENGGRLVEFAPVKESLEDYFIRVLEAEDRRRQAPEDDGGQAASQAEDEEAPR